MYIYFFVFFYHCKCFRRVSASLCLYSYICQFACLFQNCITYFCKYKNKVPVFYINLNNFETCRVTTKPKYINQSYILLFPTPNIVLFFIIGYNRFSDICHPFHCHLSPNLIPSPHFTPQSYL